MKEFLKNIGNMQVRLSIFFYMNLPISCSQLYIVTHIILVFEILLDLMSIVKHNYIVYVATLFCMIWSLSQAIRLFTKVVLYMLLKELLKKIGFIETHSLYIRSSIIKLMAFNLNAKNKLCKVSFRFFIHSIKILFLFL